MPCSAAQQSNYLEDSEAQDTKVWMEAQEYFEEFLATNHSSLATAFFPNEFMPGPHPENANLLIGEPRHGLADMNAGANNYAARCSSFKTLALQRSRRNPAVAQ